MARRQVAGETELRRRFETHVLPISCVIAAFIGIILARSGPVRVREYQLQRCCVSGRTATSRQPRSSRLRTSLPEPCDSSPVPET